MQQEITSEVDKLAWHSDSLFRLLFEKSADASLLLRGNTIIGGNEAAVQLFGCTNQSQLLGKHPAELSPPVQPDGQSSQEKESRLIDQATAAGTLRFEWLHRRLDERDFPAEVLLTVIPFDDQPIIHTVIRDITKRKRTIQSLEAQVKARTQEIEYRQRLEQLRREELQTLLDITAATNSSLDLDEMLTATLDRLVVLVQASRAAVLLKEDGASDLTLRLIRPERTISSEVLAEMLQTGSAVMSNRQSYFTQGEEPGAFLPLRASRPSRSGRSTSTQTKRELLGVLDIIGAPGGEFSREQIALFEAIADQIGVALETSRLYEQAEQAAVAAERSRIARDLHDSVTQTLFSAGLIAEVLPKLWDRNQEEARRRLEELRQLTRGALAEMRTLLLELRPVTLAEAGLGELLRQLTDATIGRARVPIDLQMSGQDMLPAEVKTAFYRITQEALNNVVKHASATQVSVVLDRRKDEDHSDRVVLLIEDDGRGFEPAKISPDHLGLSIMQERAGAIMASLKIDSHPGAGTKIIVTWVDTVERG